MNPRLVLKVATRLAQRKGQSPTGRRSLLRPVWMVFGAAGFLGSMMVLVMLLAVAAIFGGAPATAAGGALGIPPVVFSAYLAAEANAPSIGADCEVDWPVIAGIWKVESQHATTGRRSVDSDGQVTPPLYGIVLDGATPGTRIVPDTDQGVLDGDPVWDRAVGPAQFLPGSWESYGRDGNGNGIADPQNVYDAALATVAYLCLRSPGDYMQPDDLTRALYGYNNSTEYVDTVTGWVDYYRAFAFTAGSVTADGLYAFPLPVDSVTAEHLRRSHHDYPASDLMVPEGTPVYAAHPGTVTAVYTPCPTCKCGWGITITGRDDHRYTYCHGTAVAAHIEHGVAVAAGELIMASGNTGNSEAPHLHFQIRNPQGLLVCPQPLLEAWRNGIGLSPIAAPIAGCTH